MLFPARTSHKARPGQEKLTAVLALITRPNCATIPAIIEAAGWNFSYWPACDGAELCTRKRLLIGDVYALTRRWRKFGMVHLGEGEEPAANILLVVQRVSA